ncbi:hypothetical protein FRB99_001776 [Tulasnella sp. 403]|nr:hypothetical protein FRB99_001776 [Tulasnella sp. 403]
MFTSLSSQVEGAIEMVDLLRKQYPSAKILVAGHSIGAWMALKVLKERPQVAAVFLLFPTISDLANTPNGIKLAWLFWPISAVIAAFFAPFLGLLPLFVFKTIFPQWPISQLLVLKEMLLCSSAVTAALRLARDEMASVKTLDIALLQYNSSKLYSYYAKKDDWIGVEKDAVVNVLGRSERVHEDNTDTPHAFCITEHHSQRVADQCSLWLSRGGFTNYYRK